MTQTTDKALDAEARRSPEEAMASACAHLRGEGGQRDPVLARQYLRTAALRGDPRAMAGYAFMLALGDGGPQDDNSAVLWFDQAAKRDDSSGHFGLAVAHAYGRTPELDPIRAYTHYLLAGQGQEVPRYFGDILRGSLSRRDRDLAIALAERWLPTEQ